MKRLEFIVFVLLATMPVMAQIALNDSLYGITNRGMSSVKIESILIVADLTRDSANVTAVYSLSNNGSDTVVQMAYPDIYYQNEQRDYRIYTQPNIVLNHISVNNSSLSFENLYFPTTFDSLLTYFEIINSSQNDGTTYYKWRELRNRVDLQMRQDALSIPWYVWNESILLNEEKVIEIKYTTRNPNIVTDYYGHEYEYLSKIFKHTLFYPYGWNGTVGKATVIVNINDRRIVENMEKIEPMGYTMSNDSTCIIWKFSDLSHSHNNKIYLQFCNKKQYPIWSPLYDKYDIDNYH